MVGVSSVVIYSRKRVTPSSLSLAGGDCNDGQKSKNLKTSVSIHSTRQTKLEKAKLTSCRSGKDQTPKPAVEKCQPDQMALPAPQAGHQTSAHGPKTISKARVCSTGVQASISLPNQSSAETSNYTYERESTALSIDTAQVLGIHESFLDSSSEETSTPCQKQSPFDVFELYQATGRPLEKSSRCPSLAFEGPIISHAQRLPSTEAKLTSSARPSHHEAGDSRKLVVTAGTVTPASQRKFFS